MQPLAWTCVLEDMMQLDGVEVIDMASFPRRFSLSLSLRLRRHLGSGKVAPLLYPHHRSHFTEPSLEQGECMRTKMIVDGPAARSAAAF